MDARTIAEEALTDHDGWYRFSDRRRRTDEIHALARAYLEALKALDQLEASGGISPLDDSTDTMWETEGRHGERIPL